MTRSEAKISAAAHQPRRIAPRPAATGTDARSMPRQSGDPEDRNRSLVASIGWLRPVEGVLIEKELRQAVAYRVKRAAAQHLARPRAFEADRDHLDKAPGRSPHDHDLVREEHRL